jgi:hypothetical protein
MPEEQETRRRRPPPDSRPRSDSRPRDEERSDSGRTAVRERLRPMDAANAALEQIAELTGRQPQGIVSLEPADGGWIVGVEVVEDRRIPSSTDVLALYEIELDRRGDLRSYSRKRRYARGDSDGGGGPQ